MYGQAVTEVWRWHRLSEEVYLAKKKLAQALAVNKRASGEVTCRVLVSILLRSDARKYILYYLNSDRVGGKERYLKRGSSGSRTSVLGWDLV